MSLGCKFPQLQAATLPIVIKIGQFFTE